MTENADIVTTPDVVSSPTFSVLGSGSAHEFIRYAVASAIAFAVDVGSLWFLTDFFGLRYLLSGAIAFILGLSIVYSFSIMWVFEHRSFTNWKAEYALFAAIGIVGLVLNEACLWFLTSVVGFHYLISKLVSQVLIFAWNFGARKMSLFR
jgi:putative flippase GtrA